MRITPREIRTHPFRKTRMGFDKEQVNSVLQQIANEFEAIVHQNDAMTTQVHQLEETIKRYEKIEKTLNETLLSAQRASDDARTNAQKEAELIIKDAQIRADKYVDKSRQVVSQMESELMTLRMQRNSFLVRFKSMLHDQLSLLEVISENFAEGRGDKTKETPRILKKPQQVHPAEELPLMHGDEGTHPPRLG